MPSTVPHCRTSRSRVLCQSSSDWPAGRSSRGARRSGRSESWAGRSRAPEPYDARALPATADREHVLGVAEALFGLPAVGGRFAAIDRLELRLGCLELLTGTRVVDLRRLDGVVDERDRAVLEHLE